MQSLRSRLTFTHALVALVAVATVAVLVTAVFRTAFNRLAGQQAQLEAEVTADRLADFYQRRGAWDGVDVLLRRQFGQPPGQPPGQAPQRRRLQVFDAQGELLFDSIRASIQRRLPPPPDGAQQPIVVDGRRVGTVIVGGQRSTFNQAEGSFLVLVYLSVIGGSVLAGGVALVVGRLITGRVTRPLRSLKDAAQRLAAGQRHEPLALPPDRELAELAAAFNIMGAQLEHQQHLRRQLVADIAHELRTPLSVLRLQIESLEDGIAQPTPATLGSLSEEVGLLTHLVEDLRLLSLADAGQLALAIEEVDAGGAVERAALAALARARQQGIELRAEPPPAPQAVAADPQRLAQVLGNLIENALRYTPAGGHVAVRASSKSSVERSELGSSERSTLDSQSSTQSWVVFEVTDTGPGIPPDELAHIFDRFYRTDKARARETGGSGLGLAIVQRLVEVQGGRIWASSTLGHGATFHIALPAAPRPQAAPTRSLTHNARS